MSHDPQNFLQPTWYIDSDHPAISEFAQRVTTGVVGERQRAVALFYAVRDEIRYSAYGIRMERASFRGSYVLEKGSGWCVNKSVLLAAAARAVGIPCRLGYANVRNHLATEKLLTWLGTDIFYYHGYNELYLEGRWVKATVAFNRQLCEKARLAPLDFDGVNDSLYHPYDLEGQRHMEYLHDYGTYDDVQYEAILRKFAEAYPIMAELIRLDGELEGDFEAEIAAEAAARQSRE